MVCIWLLLVSHLEKEKVYLICIKIGKRRKKWRLNQFWWQVSLRSNHITYMFWMKQEIIFWTQNWFFSITCDQKDSSWTLNPHFLINSDFLSWSLSMSLTLSAYKHHSFSASKLLPCARNFLFIKTWRLDT